jgi:hypothetical protein
MFSEVIEQIFGNTVQIMFLICHSSPFWKYIRSCDLYYIVDSTALIVNSCCTTRIERSDYNLNQGQEIWFTEALLTVLMLKELKNSSLASIDKKSNDLATKSVLSLEYM